MRGSWRVPSTRTLSTLCLLASAYGQAFAQTSDVKNEAETALPPTRERPSVLEFTLFLPVQFLQTRNRQGPATAYSALGYGLDAALCLTEKACVLAKGITNLDARNGAALLSGVSAGAHTFLLGRSDPPPDSSGAQAGERRPARMQSIWRVAVQAGLCRKDFDFRSLYAEEQGGTSVFIGARPELEGSFWCYDGGLTLDYLFRSGHRISLGTTYFWSLAASQSNLEVSGPTFQLGYQILRF